MPIGVLTAQSVLRIIKRISARIIIGYTATGAEEQKAKREKWEARRNKERRRRGKKGEERKKEEGREKKEEQHLFYLLAITFIYNSLGGKTSFCYLLLITSFELGCIKMFNGLINNQKKLLF